MQIHINLFFSYQNVFYSIINRNGLYGRHVSNLFLASAGLKPHTRSNDCPLIKKASTKSRRRSLHAFPACYSTANSASSSCRRAAWEMPITIAYTDLHDFPRITGLLTVFLFQQSQLRGLYLKSILMLFSTIAIVSKNIRLVY